MKNEFAGIQEPLKNTIPRKSLSPAAAQRFEESYRMLGSQKEPEHNHRKSRRAWIVSVASLAACFALLFGTNAAFPAFAESLPVVGRVFQSINDSFRTHNSMGKKPAGTYVGTYEVQEITASTASFENNGYRLSVNQAYSDGSLVTFSMTLETPPDALDRYESIFYPDISAAINGKAAEITSGTGFYPENDSFTGTMVLALPQTAENGTPLDISVSVPNIRGKDKTAKDDYIPLGASFSLEFQVNVDTAHNKSFTLESGEDNGAKILGVESTPATTKITAWKPYWGFIEGTASVGFPALYLEDGTQIAFNAEGSDEIGYDPWAEEPREAPLLFDGVPADTETVVFRFYKDYGYTDVLAEFTIDLTDGSAVPTKTYEEGGALDIDSPYNYSSVFSKYEGDAPQWTNDFALKFLEYSTDRSQFMMHIATTGDYQELKVEAYNAGGSLIGVTVSQYGTLYENENWYWDEESPFWGDQFGGLHTYQLYLTPEDGFLPAWKEAVTVKITDNSTGEEILTKTMTLSERAIFG